MIIFVFMILQNDDINYSIYIYFAAIIFIGIILKFIYEKWFIPPNIKNSEEFEKNKYKDFDGC